MRRPIIQSDPKRLTGLVWPIRYVAAFLLFFSSAGVFIYLCFRIQKIFSIKFFSNPRKEKTINRCDFHLEKCVRVPIMADSVLTEVYRRPIKIPKWHRTCEGSKSASKKRELKVGDVEDDEYLRQYLLFHYQFHISEGFNVDWDQFDYVFSVRPLDNSPPISDTRTNAEVIRDVTLLAIEKHNEAHGTKLVFVEHVAANYQFTSGLRCWLTFWATDMASFPPESKIYQAHVWRRGTLFKTYMFRLKPKDEEIDSVEVEPPSPMPYDDYEETIGNVKILAYRLGKDKALVEHRMNKPPVAFARVDPKDGALPGVPFIFDRTGALLVRDRFGRW